MLKQILHEHVHTKSVIAQAVPNLEIVLRKPSRKNRPNGHISELNFKNGNGLPGLRPFDCRVKSCEGEGGAGNQVPREAENSIFLVYLVIYIQNLILKKGLESPD